MPPITRLSTHPFEIVIGGQNASARLLDLAARLALRGPLFLLDCGNRANPLPLARELRRLTADPVHALSNIQVARSFTCYQTTALLEQVSALSSPPPVLIFDLLTTFYDESVSFAEGSRLLEQCLRCLSALHLHASLLVASRPPPAAFPERQSFVDRLCRTADRYWIEVPPSNAAARQLSLFESGE